MREREENSVGDWVREKGLCVPVCRERERERELSKEWH